MIKHNPNHQKHVDDIIMRLDTQQNQATIEKRKEAARVNRESPSVEEVQLSNNPPPQIIEVLLRCQFTSMWESHTARHESQVTRNRK